MKMTMLTLLYTWALSVTRLHGERAERTLSRSSKTIKKGFCKNQAKF